jgi:hypothetical protein
VHQGVAAYPGTGPYDPVFSYRYDLYQPKPYPRAKASAIRTSLAARRQFIRTGEIGVYLGVYPELENQKMVLPVLDVDGVKKDPVSAIERGQALYGILYDMGLLPYARFLLSGTGIRVCFTFLLPFELQPGFMEFQWGLMDYGVDPGPYFSTDPPPIRMLCYRGHNRQRRPGDVLLDRHSTIIEHEDLMSIESVEDYHHFTQGRPDPDRYIDWLPTIIPTTCCSPENKNLPDALQGFLEKLRDLQIEAELRKNVFGDFDLAHSRTPRRLSIDKVIHYLDDSNIDWMDKDHFIKLGRCPVCGRRAKAWMTQWGVLKCFSANCGAWDAGGGLKAADWVPPDYLEYTEVEERQKPPAVFVDLFDAEVAIYDHLPKGGNIALAVTPGVGKTRAGLADAARRAEKGVVVYALPNHRLIDECAARVDGFLDKRIPILHFWGRRPEDPATCFNYSQVKEAMVMGYYPAATVCLKCPYGLNRTKENGLALCPYCEQIETWRRMKRGLVFCTTSVLPYLADGDCER